MAKKKYEYKRATFYFEGKQYAAYGKTQREAEKKAAKKEFELQVKQAESGKNMTVKAWAEEWLETYKAPSIGDGQYKNYNSHINAAIIPAIGSKRLKDVTDTDLQKILNSRNDKSKSDLSKLRMTIKAIFKQARISRLISYDPAEALVLPAVKAGVRRSITDEERTQILELAESHRAGLWIKTILFCGLRPSETRALNWRHIDFDNQLIHVKQAMKARTKIIASPKSNAGIRDVPIPDILMESLVVAKGKPDEPVFAQPTTGRRHTETSMRQMWHTFKHSLDISAGAKTYRGKIIESKIAGDLVPYCLRHTYGTDLQDAGVPLNVAKYLMGHEDVSITANIYTHTTDEAIKDAVNKLNIKFNIIEEDKE